jgi:hypothetical protein
MNLPYLLILANNDENYSHCIFLMYFSNFFKCSTHGEFFHIKIVDCKQICMLSSSQFLYHQIHVHFGFHLILRTKIKFAQLFSHIP